jgi:hypothetical protein
MLYLVSMSLLRVLSIERYNVLPFSSSSVVDKRLSSGKPRREICWSVHIGNAATVFVNVN